MTFLEASKKISEYYFNSQKNGQEVLLYVDDEVLQTLFGEDGVIVFLNLFRKESNCFRNKDRAEIKNLQELTEILVNNEPLFFKDIVKKINKETGIEELSICFIKRDSKDPDYQNAILAILILNIYAHQTVDGNFNTEQERQFIEQIFIKNSVELLKKLSSFTKENSEFGFIEAINLYGISSGQYMYVGYFKYHTPLTQQNYKEILRIKDRHKIRYEIDDENKLATLFNEILETRFKKNKNAGYIVINKVINGSYKFNIIQSNSIKSGKKEIDKKIVYIDPSFYINNNGVASFHLRVRCDNGPDVLSLIIDEIDEEVNLNQDPCYKIVNVNHWPNTVIAVDMEVEYSKPNGSFFVPINRTDYWNNIYRDEFIASANTLTNSPAYYLFDSEANKKKVSSLDNNCWEEREIYNYKFIYTDRSEKAIYKSNSKFKSLDINSITTIAIISDDFPVDKYGNNVSYPYYFLPRIKITKHADERAFYRYNQNNEIEITDSEFDLNNVERNETGKIEIYIKDVNNKIVDYTLKTIELLLEPEQKKINNSSCKINPVLAIRNHNGCVFTKDNLSILENDLFSRLLYTLSEHKCKLSNKVIYRLIDSVLNKTSNDDQNKDFIAKKNVLRDLVSLGYINKENDYYVVRNVALVQTNNHPQDYNLAFRLSGSRNHSFIKSLIEIAIDNKIKITYIEKNDSIIQNSILPYVIYFYLKDVNQFCNFMESEISNSQIKEFLKVIPYVDRTFDSLIHNTVFSDVKNLIYNNYNNEPEQLIEKTSSYEPVLDGECEIIRIKNNNHNWYINLDLNKEKAYYRVKDNEWAFIFALSKNKFPFMFTKFHSHDQETADLFIPTSYIYVNKIGENISKKIYEFPLSCYKDLVYINGGLPKKIQFDKNINIQNTNERNQPLEKLSSVMLKCWGKSIAEIENIKEIEFYHFSHISRQHKEKLQELLNTKILYINNNVK